MENVTLGQIAVLFTVIAGFITSIGVIHQRIEKQLRKLFEEQLQAFDTKMNVLEERMDAVDLNSCKNYLVRFLSDVEKGEKIDEIELERFFEQYKHYTDHGGNSYIKHKVEKLKSEGKL